MMLQLIQAKCCRSIPCILAFGLPFILQGCVGGGNPGGLFPTPAPLPDSLTEDFFFADGTICGDCAAVWNTDAAGYTCGARIEWLKNTHHKSDNDAKVQVCVNEFPEECGSCCSGGSLNPDPAPSPSNPEPAPAPSPSPNLRYVANPPRPEQPLQRCEGDCDNDDECAGALKCFQRDGQTSVTGCTGSGWNDVDYCYEAGPPTPPPPPTPAPPPGADQGKKLGVVSYNTLYTNFPCCGGSDWKVGKLGETVVGLGPAIFGTQETQDRGLLERKTSGFKLVSNTAGNPVYYNPSKVSFEGVSGQFSIPRDNHAARTITYAKYKLGNTVFWHFNTHLPHKHNEAGKQGTHARIAQMLLDKRRSLGAGNSPTVITGDFNPFAANGDPQGHFEDNIVRGGFTLAYVGDGSTGGYRGLDKIFHSSAHWNSARGKDGPKGGSDHPSVFVELTLK